jgi:hypothetical protein
MENKSCSHFKNFIMKKMMKDIVIMISIIIRNYLQGENFEIKCNEKLKYWIKIFNFVKIIENKS